MKNKLEQLTVSQFVDLICGDTSVLLEHDESASNETLTVITRDIVIEYRSIADPGGSNSYFKYIEDWIKARMNLLIFTMCDNLVSLNQFERAREVLDAYGLSVSRWDNQRIAGTIQAKLAQAKRSVEDYDADNEKAIADRGNIRLRFDEQTASLMAHFKFQIDPASIRASLYANLVFRYNQEIKAKIRALQKK